MLASVFHKLHWRPALLLPNHQPVRQHPGDVLRLVFGTILLVVTSLIAAAATLSIALSIELKDNYVRN